MIVEFKQPRQIDGVTYTKGTHTVDDKLFAHWFFKACVINGVAFVKEAPVKVSVATQEEAQELVESGEAEIPEEAIIEKPKRGRKPKG